MEVMVAISVGEKRLGRRVFLGQCGTISRLASLPLDSTQESIAIKAVVRITPKEKPSNAKQNAIRYIEVFLSHILYPIIDSRDMHAATNVAFLYSPVRDIHTPDNTEPTEEQTILGKK